jgi:hypothetical protein
VKFKLEWLPLLVLWSIASQVSAAEPSAAAAPSNGTKQTGDNFLKTCTTPDFEFIGYCNGYVQAVHDTSTVRYCLPKSVTRVRLVELTTDLISTKPAFHQALAAEAILEVLNAYRCAN